MIVDVMLSFGLQIGSTFQDEAKFTCVNDGDLLFWNPDYATYAVIIEAAE